MCHLSGCHGILVDSTVPLGQPVHRGITSVPSQKISVYAEPSSAEVCQRPLHRIQRVVARAANSSTRSGSGRLCEARSTRDQTRCASRGTCNNGYRPLSQRLAMCVNY
jgi:hypothetical protein